MRRTPAIALLLMLSAACAAHRTDAPSSQPAALPPLPASPKPADNNPIATDGAGDDAETRARATDVELAPIDRPAFEAAKAAAAAGKLYEAKRLFAHLAISYPTQQGLADAYNAVVVRIADKQRDAKAQLEQGTLHTPPMPPAGYALARPPKGTPRPAPKLVKLAEAKNQITDDENFFLKNGHTAEYFVPPARDVFFAPRITGAATAANTLTGFAYTEYKQAALFSDVSLPLEVPLAYGTLALSRAIDSKPYVVAIYGDRVVAVFDEARKVRGLFDFAEWMHPAASKKGELVVGSASLTTRTGTTTAPITMATESISYDLVFALASDGLLYVEHTNLGYAKDSKGLNAYVGALDLETGSLVWHSAPLVANGRNFAVVRGAVVCGYGFTAEPDFIYVLDGMTGAVRQKVPVKSGPEHFVVKDDTVRVRTYDTDYIFDVK